MILCWIYNIFQCHQLWMMKQCLKQYFIQAAVVIASEASMIQFSGISPTQAFRRKHFLHEMEFVLIGFVDFRPLSSRSSSALRRVEIFFVTKKNVINFKSGTKSMVVPFKRPSIHARLIITFAVGFFLYSFWVSDSTNLYTRMRMKNLVFFSWKLLVVP